MKYRPSQIRQALHRWRLFLVKRKDNPAILTKRRKKASKRMCFFTNRDGGIIMKESLMEAGKNDE